MSPLSRRAFLGSLAIIPAAMFMAHAAEAGSAWTVADAPLNGYAPISDAVLHMSDGKLYRICRFEHNHGAPTVWVRAWIEPFNPG